MKKLVNLNEVDTEQLEKLLRKRQLLIQKEQNKEANKIREEEERKHQRTKDAINRFVLENRKIIDKIKGRVDFEENLVNGVKISGNVNFSEWEYPMIDDIRISTKNKLLEKLLQYSDECICDSDEGDWPQEARKIVKNREVVLNKFFKDARKYCKECKIDCQAFLDTLSDEHGIYEL